jgi:hypothetical protein
MSNLPSQPRASQPQSPSESWQTIPSSNSASDREIAGDQGSSAEDLIDLNPIIPLDQNQTAHAYVESSAPLTTTEKKKCWICLAEEGELGPDGAPANSSRWSKACACSLDAHESCLITWINQSRGGDPSKAVPTTLLRPLIHRWCALSAMNLTDYIKMCLFSTSSHSITTNA